MQRKLLIDTDPGVDDAIALMLAMRCGLFDLQAITTVCGNGTIENVTRNARYLLAQLARSDIPLHSGAARPLTRELEVSVVHGSGALGNLHPAEVPALTGDAVETIIEVVKANQGELALVALGPLTNVAQAMRQNPQVMGHLQELVMMGGAIRAPGNKNRVAEFNFFVDPEAAEMVFRFPVAKTLVPLDACNKVAFALTDFEAIANAPLREMVVAMASPYIQSISREEGGDAAPLYDALTIYYLARPQGCATYRCHIAIETEGVLTRGMAVADLRSRPEEEANTTVVDAVDEKDFRRFLIETLSRPA